MTLKQIKDYLKDSTLIASNQLSDEEIRDYKNIAFYLIKNYFFSKSIRNIKPNDLDVLLDNLIINNQILTSDDLQGYEMIDLGYYFYNQIIDDDKKLLLNYYNIDGELQHCKISFTKNYNIL